MAENLHRVGMFLMMAVACVALLAACGDDRDDLNAGEGPDGAGVDIPDGKATYAGEITHLSPFEPVTEDCVDPDELDPDGSVSSDDPPICSDPTTAPVGHVLVEEIPGEQTGNKISLTIGQDTPLFRQVSGGDPEPIVFDDLAEGDVVDVWVLGPVADSYPQQGTPDAILVRS